MGPLQTILLGVVANGLTAMLAAGYRFSTQLLQNNAKVGPLLQDQQTLERVLEAAAVRLARQLESTSRREDTIRSFLVSPEVAGIIRNLYGTHLTDEHSRSDDELQRLFRLSLSNWFACDVREIEAMADELLADLRKACSLAIDAAIESGLLSAHDARSEQRFRHLAREVAALPCRLKRQLEIKTPPLEELERFEQSYRKQCAQRYQKITPPHLDSHAKVPIERLYVAPSFQTEARAQSDEEGLALEELEFGIQRTVLLGNPGSGKSTFATKLCYDLVKAEDTGPVGGRHLTPVLVTLREYGVWREDRTPSILQFIEERCTFQLPVLEGGFESLLLNGRMLVVFDGLDELLDTAKRRLIRDDVEDFCSLYSSTPVLITSREVGYTQAPLDQEIFDVVRVAEFTPENVAEYAEKWFALDSDLNAQQCEEWVSGFLSESALVADLRANALMLALMCNIYRGDQYIPRNRPDVYEKCATLLFEKWDRSRGIRVALPFEAHVGPAIKHLAYWVYSDPTLQQGVTEEALVCEATSYLCPRQFEDEDEARLAARAFVEYCRGRAWVFTDTGTTADGERLYQFTHRTFLEYFAAAYLVRTNPTAESLVASLRPRIDVQEWDVVAQIAFQLQGKHSEGAADTLLGDLLSDLEHVPMDTRRSRVGFAARSLEFLVPSPRIVRAVTRAAVAEVVENSAASDFAAPLLMARPDNLATLGSELELAVVGYVQGERLEWVTRAIDAAVHLELADRGPSRSASTALSEDCRDILARLAEATWNAAESSWPDAARSSVEICRTCLSEGLVSLSEMVELHGLGCLFRDTGFVVHYHVHRLSIASLAARYAVRRLLGLPTEPRKLLTFDLAELGQLLVEHSPPWGSSFSTWRLDVKEATDCSPHECGALVEPLSETELGGAVLLLCCVKEGGGALGADPTHYLEPLRAADSPQAKAILRVLRLRERDANKRQDVIRAVEALGLSSEQAALLVKWCRRSVSFIRDER